ncbi:hypothetical protein [Moraxella marmotae]|uniref:hypothetical protein n=1 Tax=Moraxella marmotae TaxID=3344520 RepID=UPI0035F3ADE2
MLSNNITNQPISKAGIIYLTCKYLIVLFYSIGLMAFVYLQSLNIALKNESESTATMLAYGMCAIVAVPLIVLIARSVRKNIHILKTDTQIDWVIKCKKAIYSSLVLIVTALTMTYLKYVDVGEYAAVYTLVVFLTAVVLLWAIITGQTSFKSVLKVLGITLLSLLIISIIIGFLFV